MIVCHVFAFIRPFVRCFLPVNTHFTARLGKSLSVCVHCVRACVRVRLQSVYIFSKQSIVYCGHLCIHINAFKSINKLVWSIFEKKKRLALENIAFEFIRRMQHIYIDFSCEWFVVCLFGFSSYGQHGSNCVNSRRDGRISHILQSLMDSLYFYYYRRVI